MAANVDLPRTQTSTTYTEAREGAAAYLQSRLAAKGSVTQEEFEVPVIDISSSFSNSLVERQKVANQIQRACATSGFFYITNHGIPLLARERILKQAERFMHGLSLEQKEKLHTKRSKLGLGWEPSEYTSIAGDLETKEVFNFSYEAAMDRTGGDGKYVNLDGTTGNGNLWPKEEDLPGFYDAVKEYYSAVSLAEHHLTLPNHLMRILGPRPRTPPLPALRALALPPRNLLRRHDYAPGRHSATTLLPASQNTSPSNPLTVIRRANRSRRALRLRVLHAAALLFGTRS